MPFSRRRGCAFLKRAVAVFLILAVCFSLASCSDTESGSQVESATQITETQPIGTGVIRLAFSANDSLDPYSAQSKINRQLTSLMFDPLVKLDSGLNPVFCLAQSVESEENNKLWHISLKDARFSDGSSVSGSDVITSYELAKKAANSVYPSQLSNVKSIDAGGGTVSFQLRNSDPNFINLLDFPIIKGGSRNRKNQDKKELPPIGSGRYVYEYSNGSYSLKPNEKYYGNLPKNSVELINVPDNDAWKYAIRSGEADIYYSGDDVHDLPSFSGGTSQPRHTDFIFLSVSDKSETLGSKPIRNAIHTYLDRRQITESSFYTYAYPAVSVYPNTVKFAKGTEQGLSPSGNVNSSTDYLAQAGYSNKNEQGIYLDKNGKPLSLKLIYNKSDKTHQTTASAVSDQMRKLGISIELSALSSDMYRKKIVEEDYDLALCEMKLNKNLDLSPVFQLTKYSGIKATTTTTTTTTKVTEPTSSDGKPTRTTTAKFNAGITTKLLSAYNEYLTGRTDISEFINEFYSSLPVIPVCYRTGLTGYSSSISNAAESSVSDAYLNLENISSK